MADLTINVCPHGIHMHNGCGGCFPPRGTLPPGWTWGVQAAPRPEPSANYCRSFACSCCWGGCGSPECSNFDGLRPFIGYDDGKALHRAQHWFAAGEDHRSWLSLFQWVEKRS